MLMVCVTTPGDPITARAKMDFMEMEKLAEVTISIYCTLIYNSATMQCNEMQGKKIAPVPQCYAKPAKPITRKKSHITAY